MNRLCWPFNVQHSGGGAGQLDKMGRICHS